MDDPFATDPPSSGEDSAWSMGIAHAFRSPEQTPATESDVPTMESTGFCGRYRLVEEIARGGIGIVYRAMDEPLEREVAVKVLRNRYAGNRSMVRRFLNEAQVCAYLQHPGIVPVYEMGMTLQERPFFSMKLIEGQTLADLLANRADPERERARFIGVVEQICLTLAYAHSHRIIHRDLKPGNVMVGAFGEVQIVDWGFAKTLGSGSHDLPGAAPTMTISKSGTSSIAGSVLGTPSYMSPEQARGDVLAIDERSDVFALGAVMAEVLTGQRSGRRHERDSLEESVKKSIVETQARLDRCGADAELVDLARSCLTIDRDQRPANAAVVAERIATYRANTERRVHDAQMNAAEARGRAVEERKAHRLAMAVSYLVLVAIILGAGVIWGFDSVRRQGQLREDRAVRAAVSEASVHIARGEWAEARDVLRRARTLISPDTDKALAAQFRQVQDAVGDLPANGSTPPHPESVLARLRAITALPRHHAAAPDAYAVAFREAGLDPSAMVETSARWGPAMCLLLVPALEDWAIRAQALERPDAATLNNALDALDTDHVRRGIRSADRSRLGAMAARFDAAATPPATAATLAARLVACDEAVVAVEVLTRASAQHPRHRGLHDAAAALLSGGLSPSPDGMPTSDASGSHLADAIRHATASVALSGDSFSRTQLAVLLTAAGDRAAAAAVLGKQPR